MMNSKLPDEILRYLALVERTSRGNAANSTRLSGISAIALQPKTYMSMPYSLQIICISCGIFRLRSSFRGKNSFCALELHI